MHKYLLAMLIGDSITEGQDEWAVFETIEDLLDYKKDRDRRYGDKIQCWAVCLLVAGSEPHYGSNDPLEIVALLGQGAAK